MYVFSFYQNKKKIFHTYEQENEIQNAWNCGYVDCCFLKRLNGDKYFIKDIH